MSILIILEILTYNFYFTDGHVHSFNTLEDGSLVDFLHRVIELEEADRETMHLLIFLLMQFLSRSDQVIQLR